MGSKFGYDKIYRPDDWDQVKGNEAAVEAFKAELEDPEGQRSFLFTGESGCGKTTLARIGAKFLGCNDVTNYNEFCAAKDGGIALVREIEETLVYATPGNRVWLVDEAHALTTKAQEAFLKTLEDGPGTDYFFLCTTNPEVFKPTFMRRLTEVIVKPLSDMNISDLLEEVCEEERLEVGDDIIDKIMDIAQGSPARALKALQSISKLTEPLALEKLNDVSNVAALEADSAEMGQLIKKLFWGKESLKVRQKEILGLLSKMKKDKKDSPVSIRLALINCAGNNLLTPNGKGAKYNQEVFDHLKDERPFYNKSQAWAMLSFAINEIMEPEPN